MIVYDIVCILVSWLLIYWYYVTINILFYLHYTTIYIYTYTYLSVCIELVKAAMIEGGYPDSDDSGKLLYISVLVLVCIYRY